VVRSLLTVGLSRSFGSIFPHLAINSIDKAGVPVGACNVPLLFLVLFYDHVFCSRSTSLFSNVNSIGTVFNPSREKANCIG
jgi:hypothetical protein